MSRSSFRTPAGRDVTAVTAAEMRDVDRVAVDEVGLKLLQMMENAGRVLAWNVSAVREAEPVVVAAGSGGNGGGGMAGARHLANREVPVEILLDRPPGELTGAAAHQYRILEEMGIPHTVGVDRIAGSDERVIIVDALIGYGLDDVVRSPASDYIKAMNDRPDPVVSLDIPSGVDATTGETIGSAVEPDRTLTLALPKTGLEAVPGELFVADIGIPETVYERLGIEYTGLFEERDWIRLNR